MKCLIMWEENAGKHRRKLYSCRFKTTSRETLEVLRDSVPSFFPFWGIRVIGNTAPCLLEREGPREEVAARIHLRLNKMRSKFFPSHSSLRLSL